MAVATVDAWDKALEALPDEIAKEVLDSYGNPTMFHQCFRSEDMLDKYASGLLLIRKVVDVPGLNQENVLFSPIVGALRGVLIAARAHVQEEDRMRIQSRQASTLMFIVCVCVCVPTPPRPMG